MNGDTIARRLARYVMGLQFEDLPAPVVAKAKECVLDQLGVQLRGSTLPWVQPVYRFVKTLGGRPESTITYYGDRTVAPYAAYANSTFSYSCELQHHGAPGGAHVGVITIPTALALSEVVGASGRDLITAIVGGYQVQCQLGSMLFDPIMARHFHPQSVLGVFGAAAVAGKLLGLDEEQFMHAFAIAGSHASGIVEYDQVGGEVKRTHGAIAARNGIQAALLAREGLTGPPTVFEGKRGIFNSFAGGVAHPEEVIKGIDDGFLILQTRFRIYPTVGSLHTALDILIRLMAEHKFSYREIKEIRVGFNPDNVVHGGSIYRPQDIIGAQFSLAYSFAVRLVKGSNDLELYMDSKLWRDPEILGIADKVKPYGIPGATGVRARAARVEIALADGRTLAGSQEHSKGEPDNPLSQAELEEKFFRLATAVLPREQVEQVRDSVLRLETLGQVSELIGLLVRR
ncbi:MAG: MmgE/PrpD family protein [Chloroflexi bacterium]|nr:MmgE/PrpD family protein [Chloroflexota bacterium]